MKVLTVRVQLEGGAEHGVRIREQDVTIGQMAALSQYGIDPRLVFGDGYDRKIREVGGGGK